LINTPIAMASQAMKYKKVAFGDNFSLSRV